MVGKDLIIQIKIPLTFYKNRTGGRIKIIQGIYQTVSECLLKRQKRRRADRYSHFFQFIEKIDKHSLTLLAALGSLRLRISACGGLRLEAEELLLMVLSPLVIIFVHFASNLKRALLKA
jgi:hypothetical protein